MNVTSSTFFPILLKWLSIYSVALSPQKIKFFFIYFFKITENKKRIFSSCCSLISNFIFQQFVLFFSATMNHIEIFRAYIGEFMCKLAVVWIEWERKKTIALKSLRRFFCAFTRTGLDNLYHFAYNFLAVASFACALQNAHLACNDIS